MTVKNGGKPGAKDFNGKTTEKREAVIMQREQTQYPAQIQSGQAMVAFLYAEGV